MPRRRTGYLMRTHIPKFERSVVQIQKAVATLKSTTNSPDTVNEALRLLETAQQLILKALKEKNPADGML